MNADTAKIGTTMQRFFADKLQDKILNRKTPKKVFAVYTNYESDATGEYTYFLGEEVTSFENIDKEFSTLTIPMQNLHQVPIKCLKSLLICGKKYGI